VADEGVVEAMHQHFADGQSEPYVFHRNALWADIAEVVGFRRASICSLRITQFDRATLELEQGPVVLITPPSQKFGYQNDFQFPVWLALRVCEFDDRYRAPMLERKRVSKTKSQDRIFLSSRTGAPMTDRSMTRIMSQAMRSAGAPKGVAGHALRAKFCNDLIRSEYDARLEKGMDTSTLAIASAVAWRMGHRNPDSLFAYVSKLQSKEALLIPSEAARRVAQLKQQVEELKAEIQFLKARSA
jgi:integrase